MRYGQIRAPKRFQGTYNIINAMYARWIAGNMLLVLRFAPTQYSFYFEPSVFEKSYLYPPPPSRMSGEPQNFCERFPAAERASRRAKSQ